MKVYNLSPSDFCPCIIIKFNSITVMLDCALDLAPTMKFLPVILSSGIKRNTKTKSYHLKDEQGIVITDEELKEISGQIFINSIPEFGMPEKDLIDLSSVDIILISNYQNMLALPYITEYSDFQGIVYTTEPTNHIGRLLMLDLVNNFNKLSGKHTAHKWKNCSKYPETLRDLDNVDSWFQYFNLNDVKSSLSKVHVVGYDENFSIFGVINATAYSSGYALGSCNWVLESNYEKIVYMSGSSNLTTHPEPLNTSGMNKADVLIFNGLSTISGSNPDSMVAEFCNCLSSTLKGNGNVLVPCYPSGLVYDLLECLLTFLKQAGLSGTPIYFVSPVGKDSLAFSQIYSEWLHPNKKNKVFVPEPPFCHDELIEENRLKLFPSVHGGKWLNFKTPCIVFAGHPTLRCGDAVHFVELWGSSSNNSVIFVEPGIDHVTALSPFQPLQMKSYHFPIDTRSNYSGSAKIINELEPAQVIVPVSYTNPPSSMSHRKDMVLSLKCPIQTLNRNSVLHVDLKRKFEKIELCSGIAGTIMPTGIKPGVYLSSISGSLEPQNNKFVLREAERQMLRPRKRRFHDGPGQSAASYRTVFWGKLEVGSILKAIRDEGFADAKVENSMGSQMILLQNIMIKIENNATHIVGDDNDKLRIAVKDILIKNLSSL